MKRFVAILLCLVLSVSVISMAAFADNDINVRVINGDHTVGDGQFVIFMLDGADKDAYMFTRIDGVEIYAAIAVNEKDQPYIALKPDYVDTLKPGTHKVEFVFDDDVIVNSSLNVIPVYNPYGNPKTGDESDIALWTALLVMACGAVVVLGKKVYSK